MHTHDGLLAYVSVPVLLFFCPQHYPAFWRLTLMLPFKLEVKELLWRKVQVGKLCVCVCPGGRDTKEDIQLCMDAISNVHGKRKEGGIEGWRQRGPSLPLCANHVFPAWAQLLDWYSERKLHHVVQMSSLDERGRRCMLSFNMTWTAVVQRKQERVGREISL